MSSQDSQSSTVKAWDPLVRVFHWSLVFFFLLAFITEDDWLNLHVQAGYAVTFLIGFRLLWGLVGTRNARFMSFVKSPRVVLTYLKGMLSLKAPHYLGHNPLGAAMVIALLLGIVLVSITGMAIIAPEGNGPLAGTFFSTLSGDWMEGVHEFFANFTLLMVLIHVSGVVVSSFLEGENLVKAMVTGRKKSRSTGWMLIPGREKKFSIREQVKTNQAVTKLTYNESECLWHVETESGERYIARFIIDTSGVLANPNIPYIEGAESFQGAKFHTAQWDHDVPYAGKRVAVIGSGCSAAQLVPAIASQVDKLTVFMGKAQWIIPRSDRNYSSEEQFMTNLPGIRHIKRFMIFSYHEVRFVAFRRYPFTSAISRFAKNLYAKTLTKNLEKYIDDDKLRQHMMPDYELGCRRVIPTNTYLPALSRKNVDVDISGIEKITPQGIRTKDGKDIPLDIIVYATGFFAYSNMEKALTFQVYGSGGRHLNSEWGTEFVSYKGITVSGYANYFKVNGPNTGSGHSSQLCYMEAMVNYTVNAICAITRDNSIKAIDVRSNVQRKYVAKMKKNLKKTVWQTGGCSAFYRKNTTGEVTSLSPESVINFIFSRKWFRLSDYHLLR